MRLSLESLPILSRLRGLGELVVHPMLHVGADRVYNPLSDRTVREGDPDFAELWALLGGAATPAALSPRRRARLKDDGWLVAAGEDVSRSYYLKFVSLETHTVCNQACYFCPVSIAPREPYFMPMEFYEGIVEQLAAHRSTIEAIFLMAYNEPTVDKRFLDQCRTLFQAGLPAAVLTNGSGLTPDRSEALAAEGPLRFLSVNLSTLDRDKYRADRGGDHLRVVLRHLDAAKDLRVAEEMDIVVLGTGDERHRADFEEIRERYGSSLFNVKYFEVMDRAGYLQIGAKPPAPNQELCGCENVGSRPLQHLHITPQGRCVLCCEDYDQEYIVGDLNEASVEEVLTGPVMARMRRWVYGIEEAPADFMCRKCIYARTRNGGEPPASPDTPEGGGDGGSAGTEAGRFSDMRPNLRPS